MDVITTLLSALGLSTAAGLNAYIPLLTVGLLARYTDLIELSGPYSVIENPIFLLVLAVIALLDFVGDKIPAIDHVLHAAGIVVAPVAGAILALAANSSVGAVNPVLLAICGVLAALGAHSARATARPLATATTAGVANPIISFVEDAASLVLSFLAIVVPVIALVLVVVFIVAFVALFRRMRRPRPA